MTEHAGDGHIGAATDEPYHEVVRRTRSNVLDDSGEVKTHSSKLLAPQQVRSWAADIVQRLEIVEQEGVRTGRWQSLAASSRDRCQMHAQLCATSLQSQTFRLSATRTNRCSD